VSRPGWKISTICWKISTGRWLRPGERAGEDRMTGKNRYSAVTDDIAVEVEPFYLEERSEPSQGRYVWGYRVTIDNRSTRAVQLLSRYWHITDANGRVEEVRG